MQILLVKHGGQCWPDMPLVAGLEPRYIPWFFQTTLTASSWRPFFRR